MTFSKQMALLRMSPRDVQVEYAELAKRAFSEPGKIALLHADTGVGKSLGYLLPALEAWQRETKYRVIVATHSHNLMTQLYEKDIPLLLKVAGNTGRIPRVSRYLGYGNYASPNRIQKLIDNGGLSQSHHDWLRPLLDFDEPLMSYIDEQGEPPEGIHLSTLTHGVGERTEKVQNMQEDHLSADLIVTSHATVCVDLLNGGSLLSKDPERKTLLIVDEADLFIQSLQDLQERRLNLVQLRNKLSPHLKPTDRDRLDQMLVSVHELSQGLAFLADDHASAVASDIVAWLGELITKTDLSEEDLEISDLHFWLSGQMARYRKGIGVSTVREEPAIVSLNPYFSRLFSYYAENLGPVLLTSGTLSITHEPENGMQWARRELGITEDRISCQAVLSPKDYGRMSLVLAGPEYPRVYIDDNSYRLAQAWLTATAEHIASLRGSSLILTGSYEESQLLCETLASLTNKTLHCHVRGQRLSSYADRFRTVGGILCTPAGHSGLDLRDAKGDLVFSNLVLTRIGFPKPDVTTSDAIKCYLVASGKSSLVESQRIDQTFYLDGLHKAIRKGKQGIGRGIRSEKDRVSVHILDPRFPTFDNLSSSFSALRNMIPVRFYDRYRKAKVLCPTIELEVIY